MANTALATLGIGPAAKSEYKKSGQLAKPVTPLPHSENISSKNSRIPPAYHLLRRSSWPTPGLVSLGAESEIDNYPRVGLPHWFAEMLKAGSLPSGSNLCARF
jgi:hypothetical protein